MTLAELLKSTNGQVSGVDQARPIRDDSAGDYGTLDDSNLSWIDYLTAKASDGGNALANLGRNLAQGFSPIGTSEQGNMALQVPPIVSGIAQSYSNLAGSPSHPGNAYDLTGVPELDAPIQQDMSNVLLSLYGGNAVSGLARGGAAASRSSEAASAPIRAYRGGDKPQYLIPDKAQQSRRSSGALWMTDDPGVMNSYAGLEADGAHWLNSEPITSPEFDYHDFGGATGMAGDLHFKNPMTVDAQGANWSDVPFNGKTASSDVLARVARMRGHDGLVLKNIVDFPGGAGDGFPSYPTTTYAAISPGTVKSPYTGETLFSDNRPSLLGSALATAGENYDLPPPSLSKLLGYNPQYPGTN